MRSIIRKFIYPLVLLLGAANCASTSAQKFPQEVVMTFSIEELVEQYLHTVNAWELVTGTGVTRNQAADIWELLWSVSWVNGPWDCTGKYEGGGTLCYGETGGFEGEDAYWTVIAYYPCLPLTSWSHEWLHILSHEFTGEWDAGHQNDKLWTMGRSPEDAANTAEGQAVMAGLASGMCDHLMKEVDIKEVKK